MDNHFLLGALVSLVPTALFFKFFGKEKRSSVPVAVWLLLVALGFATSLYSLFNSTAPSFAARITAVGRASGCVERRYGTHFDKYAFRFEPNDGGKPIDMETRIMTPPMCWGPSRNFDERIYRITYLDDDNRNPSNEAIDVQVVSGRDLGWHKALDARLFGVWLGVPVGFTLTSVGLVCLKLKRIEIRVERKRSGSSSAIENT